MAQYLTFDEVGVTVAAIGILFAFVALTWKAAEALSGFAASFKRAENERIDEHDSQLQDHEERITHLEECCEEVHGKLNSDFEFQQDEKEFNKLMLEAMGQLLQHNIDGDNVSGLKDIDSRISKYLVEQSQK